MSQNDFTIANQGFPAFRADLNSALQALASCSSGATAPSTTFANQLWYDTANNILYIRNEDDDNWIKLLTLDQANDNVESLHTDAITEATSGSGVTVDGVTLKDGELGTAASPVAINSSSLNGGQFGGRRNLIINGAMQVAQRGTSFTSIGNNIYSLDRWLYYLAGSSSVSDASQSTDTPNNNFKNSLKLDVQTADTSVATSDLTCFLQKIEGQNVYQLGWGTSDAKTVTLSFWVKSTKTGIHSGAFKNSAQDRSYVFEYTVNVSNTWEHKIITVAGDTSGTWLTTNGIGVQVTFALMAGTDFTKTAGSWGAGNNYGSDNQVNVMDSASNEWYITGVQLEVGSVATPFEHRSFGEERQLCYRYYYQMKAASNFMKIGHGRAYSTTNTTATFTVPVPMRANPTGSVSAASDVGVAGLAGGGTTSVNPAAETMDDYSRFAMAITRSGGDMSSGTIYQIEADNNVNMTIKLDAEL